MTKLKIGLEDAFGTIGTVMIINMKFITKHEDEVFHVIWDEMNHCKLSRAQGTKIMNSKATE